LVRGPFWICHSKGVSTGVTVVVESSLHEKRSHESARGVTHRATWRGRFKIRARDPGILIPIPGFDPIGDRKARPTSPRWGLDCTTTRYFSQELRQQEEGSVISTPRHPKSLG
jgi:hypothetical protein